MLVCSDRGGALRFQNLGLSWIVSRHPACAIPEYLCSPSRVRLSMFVFFFSSRRRHTRSDRDWSSDVCSSDLGGRLASGRQPAARRSRLRPAGLAAPKDHPAARPERPAARARRLRTPTVILTLDRKSVV